MRDRVALPLFGVLTVVLIALTAWWYPQLPDTLASHWTGDGVANGWMSKPMFFGILWVAGYGSIAIAPVLSMFIGHVPSSLWNLPNKDYWLAPERRDATIQLLQTRLFEFCNVSLVGMAVLLHHTCAINLTENPQLDASFIWWFGAYMLFVAVWVGALLLRFRRPA